MSKITIDTDLGKVIGTEENGIRMFRGIPYAITERFELPKPYPAWDVFDATQTEVDCIQYRTYHDEAGQFYHEEFRAGKTRDDWKFAESPMTMNIISRADADRDPVLVFIHGGSFENGCIGEDPYGTSTEYAKHNILYISLGYRLNIFGLYKSGNYGLHDMVFGIKWIKEHIADYGGDPNKITIMGQSAGAMSVMDLMYTQTLKGVIQGAIMMSGGGAVPDMAGPLTPEESDEIFWSKVRDKAGAKSEEEFKAMPAQTIHEAWLECARSIGTVRTQQPGIDGTIIPKMPSKIMREGSYLDVPVIAGVTSQDFMPYIIYDIAEGMGIIRAFHRHFPVWGYMFDKELPGKKYKAFHAADLWYMFGNMDKSWRPFGEEDFKLRDEMVQYVTNFVYYGNPNGGGLPFWPSLGVGRRKFRYFGDDDRRLIGPVRSRNKEWKTFLRDKGPM